MSHPTNPAKRYHAHITREMQRASAAQIDFAGYTRCPKCGRWIKDTEIINGVFPVHYLIGKIPCGWNK